MQNGCSARVSYEQAKSQKVTLSWARMQSDRVVCLAAVGRCVGRFAQRTVTGGRALVLGTSRRQVAHQGRVPGHAPRQVRRVGLVDAFAAKARRSWAGRLVRADGGERLGEDADVVAAVVGVPGYPDAARACRLRAYDCVTQPRHIPANSGSGDRA
jgi:hypothetical protein